MLPISTEETDRVEIKNHSLILKSYGLPMIFWGYLAGILIVIAAMALAIKGPLLKLLSSGDAINLLISLAALAVLIFIPTFLLAAFFYEKVLIKRKDQLTIVHRLFWAPILTKKYQLAPSATNATTPQFFIGHFLDSPNMARINKQDNMNQFENKGYFELMANILTKKKTTKSIFIDRHSRKADVLKLKTLLDQY